MDFDATEQVNELARMPAPRQPIVPAAKWNGWSAPLRGLSAAVAEVGAFAADAAQGYGQVQAASGARAGGMFAAQTEAEQREQEEQAERMHSQGVDTDSEIGRSLRNVSRDYRPDPATAGLAERLTFDLFRFAGKAVGYAAATGPAAPLLLGGDEAMQVSADLQEQGVDRITAAEAGLVAGAGAAAGIVLPVAAPGSVAKTLGLWAVGGPGAFIAQQAATREILADADYGALAQQYDPLDPVGLAVASLVPGAFAAYALRGARARPALTPEQVDAAMTHDLTLQQDVRETATPEQMAKDFTPEDLERIQPRETPSTDAALPAARAAEGEEDAVLRDALARADEIEATTPDMVVQRTEDGQEITASQALERIRREAQEGTDTELGAQDASLLDVAAQCALSIGSPG